MAYSLTQEQRDLIEIVGSDVPTFRRPAYQAPDKLSEIFAMQAALDQRIISERGIEKTTDEWVLGLTIAMEAEIDEVRRLISWKWWKNPKPIDFDELRGEVIDLWHFLVSLSEKVGLTADDVYRVYCEKNAENHARQDGTSAKEGYEVKAEVSEGKYIVTAWRYGTRHEHEFDSREEALYYFESDDCDSHFLDEVIDPDGRVIADNKGNMIGYRKEASE